jgi:4-amino-4-deoxy-L-arabinose transferase-like glycosyltransferase
MENINNRKTEYVFLFAVFCLASFLFFSNLGNHYLWQDEAETALVGKTIMEHGIPLGFDGKNFFSQAEMEDLTEKYVWKWHTWFQYYVTAASFSIFGINNFSARFPFVLFGIASVILVYFFTLSLFRDRRTAKIATVLLLVSVPFLVASRQCRYYAPAAFFTLFSLYCYLNIIENKKYAKTLFVLSSILLFHTAFPYCIILLVTVSIHSLLWHREKLASILIISAAVFLINLPWLIWTSDIQYSKREGIVRFVKYASTFISQTGKYIFSPLLFLVPLIVGAVTWKKSKRFFSEDQNMWRSLFLLIFYVFGTIGVFFLKSPFPFFRYLVPLIPIFCIITSLIVVSVAKLHIALAVGVFVFLIAISPFTDFLYEITHNYDGPVEGIAKYLNANGSDNHVVAITCGDLPLKFYTNMKVIGALSGEDYSAADDADWLIIRKYSCTRKGYRFATYLARLVNLGNYQKIVIDYPDIAYENREGPRFHKFRTVKNEDRVTIYRKK